MEKTKPSFSIYPIVGLIHMALQWDPLPFRWLEARLSMLTSCLCFVAFFLHLENDSCRQLFVESTGYSLIPCLAVSWYFNSIDMLRDGGVQWKTHTLLSWISAMMLTWQCLLYLMVMAAGMEFSEFMLKPPSYYARLLFSLWFLSDKQGVLMSLIVTVQIRLLVLTSEKCWSSAFIQAMHCLTIETNMYSGLVKQV